MDYRIAIINVLGKKNDVIPFFLLLSFIHHFPKL